MNLDNRTCLVLIGLMLVSCDRIDTRSERDCGKIHSDISSQTRNVLIPVLKEIETIAQYRQFVRTHVEYVEEKDADFRDCMSKSAFTANDEEMSRWIDAGVSLNALSFFWGQFSSKPDSYDQSDMADFISRDLLFLRKIIAEQEIS